MGANKLVKNKLEARAKRGFIKSSLDDNHGLVCHSALVVRGSKLAGRDSRDTSVYFLPLGERLNCYELHPGHTPDNRGLACTLTPDQRYRHIRKVTEPGEKKNFFLNIGHAEDWRFTPEMLEAFAGLLVLVRLKEGESLPDVIGDVAATFPFREQGQPILFSPKLQEMLSQFDPSHFEYVPAGPIIERASMREIENHGFAYISFLDDRDTYDRENTKIKKVKQYRGGREFLEVSGNTTHLEEKIEGGVIWREAIDGRLMCSDQFREAFEGVGGVGIEFFPMKTIDIRAQG